MSRQQPRTVRIVVSDREHTAVLPGHPDTYEVTEPGEVREVTAALASELTPGVEGGQGFECMCLGEYGFALYDASGQQIRTVDRHGSLPLLDPGDPHSIPGRHRAAWAAAAPEPLRRYAREWARGEPPAPGTVTVPLSLVFTWLGTAPAYGRGGGDAARALARLAPLALLGAAQTDELAWAVRETDAAGLDGAVEFFASDHFTTRHPKKRRVGATARDRLLRCARMRRPEHIPVLERRLLPVTEDRIRR